MNKQTVLKHQFVEFIPQDLDEGTIYVSIRFATASHLCACGCKNKVVTPIRPRDWTLIFDGKTISLQPSIGNWSFPCQSHYWVRNDHVQWVEKWSKARIDAGRAYDRLAKEGQFHPAETVSIDAKGDDRTQTKPNAWRRLRRYCGKLLNNGR